LVGAGAEVAGADCTVAAAGAEVAGAEGTVATAAAGAKPVKVRLPQALRSTLAITIITGKSLMFFIFSSIRPASKSRE
jgi:hypothetical protein